MNPKEFFNTCAYLAPILRKRSVNLTATQFFAMCYLQGASPADRTLSRLSQGMGFSTAASTGAVDSLERLGLVLRHQAPEDRRKMHVKLTDKGTQTMERLEKILEAHQRLLSDNAAPAL